MDLAEAIKVAIKTCLNKNILVDFLREHGSEVENMIFGEWNWDEAKEVWQEEAREETWEKAQKERDELFAYLKQGHSLDEAEKVFNRVRKS